MKIAKSYKGYVTVVDKNMSQYKVQFEVVVEIGLFSYILGLGSHENYVMDIAINDIRAVIYEYNCKNINMRMFNEIETSVKYSLKKELAMYRDYELKNLHIKFITEI